MDRRTLLAVVLAALVMIGYQFIFAPHPQPAGELATTEIGQSDLPNETTDPVVSGGAEESDSGRPLESPTSKAFLESGGPAFPVDIDTPLYHASLDPQGATISNWELREYTDKQELPAELVASAADGLLQFRIVQDDGVVDLTRAVFQSRVTDGPEGHRVQLSAESSNGLRCDIVYAFSETDYVANVEVLVNGTANQRGDGEIQILFPHTLPHLERLNRQDDASVAAVASVGGKLIREIAHKKKDGWLRSDEGTVEWFGVRSKYFLAALVPDGAIVGEVRTERTAAVDGLQTQLSLPLAVVGQSRYAFRLYAGPMELERLTALDAGLDRAVDLGWTWIRPFSRLLLRILNWIHQVIPNYGVAVLILSIVAKLVFYPLTRKSLQSMQGLQALKPEMDRINAEFKDDPKAKQQAVFDLYKKHKVNPAGGCLPMLVQMPVFVALYQVLSNAIELRKEPFMLWISDLSAPDAIGSVMGLPIHILPVLMAVTMFLQQKMTPTDPRQAALTYMMPVMMLFFFYSLPSGLVLYWTVSNVLQIGQQALINKETRTQMAAA